MADPSVCVSCRLFDLGAISADPRGVVTPDPHALLAMVPPWRALTQRDYGRVACSDAFGRGFDKSTTRSDRTGPCGLDRNRLAPPLPGGFLPRSWEAN